jgi:hypothetical protein
MGIPILCVFSHFDARHVVGVTLVLSKRMATEKVLSFESITKAGIFLISEICQVT